MTDDKRYLHDPFAPPPRSLVGAVAPPPVEDEDDGPGDEHGDAVDGDGFDDLTKPELQDELERRGLPTSGNKPDLIARLRGRG